MLPMPSRTTSSVSFSRRSIPSSCAWIFLASAALLTLTGLSASAFFFSTRAATFSRLAARSSGTSAVVNFLPSASAYSSPRECLQGNCRLGQVQR